MLCPIEVNSNTIELTVHTSCYCILDLLCVYGMEFCFLNSVFVPELKWYLMVTLLVHKKVVIQTMSLYFTVSLSTYDYCVILNTQHFLYSNVSN